MPKSNEIELSIIIVKFKSDKYLKDCLYSIRKTLDSSFSASRRTGCWNDKAGKIKHEVIVVDNDKKNIGYGAGINMGAKKAKGKYLLFLNPDTYLFPDSIENMICFMEKNMDVGVVGPKIYKDKEKSEVQLSFCKFPNLISAFVVYGPLKKYFPRIWRDFTYGLNKINVPFSVDAVSGAVLMVRRNVFEEIGGFDEKYFLYFEENDFCRRIKLAGRKIYFLPFYEAVHFGQGSTFNISEANYHFKKSRKYFLEKYYGFWGKAADKIIWMIEKK